MQPNSFSVPYLGDVLDRAAKEAMAKLKAEHNVGVVFAFQIGTYISHVSSNVDNCDDGMRVFCKGANRAMQEANQPDLPLDVVRITCGWDKGEEAILDALVQNSLDLMAY